MPTTARWPQRILVRALCMCLAAWALLWQTPASAHGMRTGYVELHERAVEPGDDARVRVDVLSRSNATYGSLHVAPPAGCAEMTPTMWSCAHSLRGETLRVSGLQSTLVADAVLVVTFQDGTTASGLVRSAEAMWTVPPGDAGRGGLADLLLRYARAGFVHVSSGADHLLFLAALVIALRKLRAVVLAETAFTVSHSIALAAATLGWIHVPQAVAEQAIALSLVLLALDLRPSSSSASMKPRAGAFTAFVFGSVHGLGFAGGLEELGVPKTAIAPALGGFAIGVELAQIVFLALCFAVLHVASRRSTSPRWLARGVTYAVGGVGTFWLIDRFTSIASPH